MRTTIDLSRIHPVTDFVRNYKSFLTRIKETGRPEVLTVNGIPECVLVDAKTFQEMTEAWEEARFLKAVNEGIECMNRGTSKTTAQAFHEIRTKLEI